MYQQPNFTEVFERITDAFVALDNNWNYTYMNKKAGEIFNRNSKEMIGKNIWTEFPEGIEQTFYKAYHRAMAEQQYIHVEEYYPPYDKWFENHIYPSPEGLSIFFRDVTDKKKADKALGNNHIFIESIITAYTDIIYIYDIEDKRNIYSNEGIQLNLGYTTEEIKLMGNQVLSLLMHPEDFDYYLHTTYPRYATAKDKEIISHEFRMKNKNGNWKWFYCKESIFLRKQDGTPKQVLGITVDITERKKAEEEIKVSEEKFRTLVHQAADGIFLCDLDGNYLEANEGAAGITGYSIDELKQMNGSDIVPAEELKKTPIKLEEIKRGGPVYVERVIRRKDNVLLEVEISAKLIVGGKVIVIMRDITERKIVELIIRESEEKYRDLIDNIQDLICTHDLEGRILSVNPAATKLLGYTKDEMLNMNLRDIIIPAFRNKFDDYLVDISKNGNAKGLMLIQTSSGETRIWEYNNTLRTQGVDKPIVRGLSRDITERKKAEETLHESEERFRALYEENPLMNFTIAADGKILSVNKRGAEQLGYTVPELLGNTVLNVFYKEDHTLVIHQLKECLANPNKSFSWSLRKITKSKETIWVSETGTAIKDRHGNYSVLIVCENITERKKNEEEKLQAEKKYRLLFENNITAIYRTSFAGEILECNKAMANFFGYDLADELKRNKADFLYYNQGDRNEFLKLLKEKKALYNYETMLKRKDGTPVYLLENISLVESSEYPEGIIEGVSIDITERKKVEKEIKATTEQLRQLTAHLQNIREEERKRIGREIHDELGQQLTAIKMDVAWIDKKTPEDVALIKTKLKNIIGLLDGSHISVKRILNELRTDILESYGLTAALEWQGRQFTINTGMALSFTCAEADLKVEDPIATCIFRVFQEALTNITKYAEAQQVIASLILTGNKIVFNIEDDGKGFDTKLLINSRSFGILGMRERVASVKGKFQLTSSPGKGTKIVITIPVKM